MIIPSRAWGGGREGRRGSMTNVFDELQARGFIQQVTHPEALKERLRTERLTFYVGFDPTANSLHIGHLLPIMAMRSEEHTSELQSPCNLVCRLLLEKKTAARQSPRSSAPPQRSRRPRTRAPRH